ncbi:hypothetical protein EVAR_18620_1 [Eumeta japonica]|uniref:Uncharacterized protein n=1 Tax=Eumeta variegata TaxID=151549 RepID=A0A4C1U6P0_EUMVA|nr:hypothetical protein EVAR_18620_1 [Eumeta japonica]
MGTRRREQTNKVKVGAKFRSRNDYLFFSWKDLVSTKLLEERKAVNTALSTITPPFGMAFSKCSVETSEKAASSYIMTNSRGANEQKSNQTVDGHCRSLTLVTPDESLVHCWSYGRNRVSNGGGKVDEMGRGEWVVGALTHWTKCTSGSCYFTFVFCESVIGQLPNAPASSSTYPPWERLVEFDKMIRHRIKRCWHFVASRERVNSYCGVAAIKQGPPGIAAAADSRTPRGGPL